MKQILIFLLSVCSLFAAAQPSITDTTKLSVFDRTNAWVTTGALLKAYCAAGGGGSVATDAIWDAAGDLAVGTGANTASRLAIGTSLQQLRVNSGGTALEYFTPSASSGDLVNGGQSTGATVSYGTTDAQAAAIKTNSVERFSITGGASTGGAATLTNVTANTNTVQDVLTVRANSSGTAAASFGPGLLFQGESSTTDNQNMVRLSSIWTTATHASRTSALVYSDVSSAGAITERFRFSPSAMTTAVSYTLGNSANSITIGGGTGQVTVTSSNSTAGSIYIYNSLNTAAAVGAISVGAALSFTQTSATRNYMNFDYGFAPTSGTAVHNQLSFTGTINQTGGASGIVRGINLAHTMTAAADYRAIEIADNLATAKGIYQTGALTTNNFVGKTKFGATSAPAQAIDVTGNIIASGSISSTRKTTTLAAAATTLAITNDVVTVTGDAGGNTLATITGGLSGQILTLIFVDNLVTITDNSSGTANTVNIASSFSSTSNDVLTLVFDGTSWREVTRSIN